MVSQVVACWVVEGLGVVSLVAAVKGAVASEAAAKEEVVMVEMEVTEVGVGKEMALKQLARQVHLRVQVAVLLAETVRAVAERAAVGWVWEGKAVVARVGVVMAAEGKEAEGKAVSEGMVAE